jgi:cytochrome bd ubiquinol oxidase subunit I
MELGPVFLSRVQFAFVISFHIIFLSFTIGLAAWLATIEGVRLRTGNPVRRLPTRSASWLGGPQDD